MSKYIKSTYFRAKFVESKKLFFENKVLSIVYCCCLFIGIALCFSKITGIQECGNLYLYIKEGDFNVLFYYLKIIVLSVLLYVIPFLLSINFFVFLLNTLYVIVFTEIFLFKPLTSCFVDGFCGVMALIFLDLPLFVINALFLLTFLIKLFNEVGFACSKKLFIPYKFHFNTTKKLLIKFIGTSTAFNLFYTLLFMLIFYIIT